MKNLLFALLLISGSAFGQTGHILLDPSIRLSTYQLRDDSAIKFYEDTAMNKFKILYVYDSRIYMEPATYPPGAPHYNAIITVFLKKGKKWIQVGPSFGGTYVKEGCFEDVPADQVAKARNNGIRPEPVKQADIPGQLGMDTMTIARLGIYKGPGISFAFTDRWDTTRCIFLASDTTATYRGKMKIEDHLVFWMFGYIVQHSGTTWDAPIYLDPEKKPVTYFIWDVKYIK